MWQSGQRQQAKQLHTKLFHYISKSMTHCEYIIEVEKGILQNGFHYVCLLSSAKLQFITE
ncbi:hypothetical protein VAE122_120004 [Vibrio aestuarianus]|nr:hypothetical protein VAE122_120004 [Vibrio aestuarianus]